MAPDGGAPDRGAPDRGGRGTSRRRLRRAATIAAIGTCAVIALLAILVAALHTPPARRAVLSRALQYLASHDLDVQAQSLQYNLFRGTVDLRDVVVRGRGLPDAPPVARIARLSLGLGVSDLIAGRVIVHHGALDRPELHLLVDEQGRSNLPTWSPTEPAGADSTLTWLVEQFALTDGRVRYEDRRQQLDVQLPIASLTIAGDRAVWRHQARLLAGPGRLTLHGREAELDRIDGAVAFDRDALRIERLDLGAAGSTVSLGGNLIRFTDPRYDLAIGARLDVTRFAAFAGFAEPVGGIVSAQVKLRGPLPELKVDTTIAGDDLSFRTLRAVQLGADATYDAAAGQARVARLDVQSPFGRVHGRGVVALDATPGRGGRAEIASDGRPSGSAAPQSAAAQPSPAKPSPATPSAVQRGAIQPTSILRSDLKEGESALEAEVAGIDIAALTSAFAVPYGAASRVEGRVRARWPLLDYARATGEAMLTLTPTRTVPSRGLAPLAGTLTAAADPQTVVVDVASLRGMGADVRGRVTLRQRRTLDGVLRATSADVATVMSAAEAFLGRKPGTLAGVPVTGSATVDARLGGSIDVPSVQATLAAPNLSVGAAPVTPSIATLAPSTTPPAVQADTPSGTTAATLSGTATTTPTGTTAAIPAGTTVAIPTDVRSAGLSGLEISAQAAYTPDAVVVDRLAVAWQDARLQARGRLGLRGRQPLALEASAEQLQIADVLAALGKSEVVASGVVSMQAKIDGTVADPSGTARLTAADLTWNEDDLGRATLDAVIADRRAKLHAVADAFKVTADATIATSAPYATTADVIVADLDLASLPLKLDTPLIGVVRAKLTGAGTLLAPADSTAAATVERLDVTWNGQPISTDGPASLRYADRQLTIDRLVVRALDSTASVRGTLPLDTLPLDPRTSAGLATGTGPRASDGLPIGVPRASSVSRIRESARTTDRSPAREASPTREGTIELDARLNLATMARYAPESVGLQAQGDMRLAGTLRGSLQRVDPKLTLTIAEASIATPALKPGLTNVGARLETADGLLRIADVHASWGAAQLLATGEIPFGWLPESLPVELPRATGAAKLQASLTGLDLATIPGAPGNVTEPSTTVPAGKTTVPAGNGIEDQTQSPADKRAGNSTEARIENPTETRTESRTGNPTESRVEPPTEARPENLPESRPGNWTERRAENRVEKPVEKPVGKPTGKTSTGKLTGLVSVRADLEAPRPDVNALVGRLTFPELRADFSGLTLAQREPSTIVLNNGEVRVERFSLDGTVGQVDLTGRASLLGDWPIDAAARARLNLAALSTFTTAVRAAGQATIEVTATGTAAAPALRGFAELADGRLTIQDPQIGAQRLQARVDFTPQRVTLSRLEGILNGGTLSGSGGFALGDSPGQSSAGQSSTGQSSAGQGSAGQDSAGQDRAGQGRAAQNSVGQAGAGPDAAPQDGASQGGAGLGMGVRDLRVQLKANDVALDQPLNLRSLTDADLTITQKADDIVIGGAVTVQEAGLTDNINLDSGLLAALTAPPSLELTEERSPLLERVRFDITLTNATPIIVDNNLARAEIDTDLRILGTPYETGLNGRLQLAEGSELILNERRYEVERGIVTFVDDRRIVPSLDILLRTTARRYDVSLEATGTADDTQTTLTSSPTLPEPDILALLVTGRTLDEMRGEEFEVAQSQVLSYVGGRVGSTLGKGLERATGLSTVRIEPNLIASEADPGARLTVGQDLTEDVSLVYSTDLVNSSDQIWVAEYDVTRQFTTRAVRQSDNSYRFDVRHDLRFGGRAEPRRDRRTSHGTVGTVTIAGTPILPEAEIRDRLGLSTGDAYTFFELRDGLRRVNELYRDRGWLQARVRPERVVRGGTVDLTLQVTAGPKVDLLFEGYQPSAKLLDQIREIWHRGVFDTQRADDVTAAVRAALIDDQYLEPQVEYAIDGAARSASTGPASAGSPAATPPAAAPSVAGPSAVTQQAAAPSTTAPSTTAPSTTAPSTATPSAAAASADARRVTFRVTPGVRFDRVALVFDGARGIEPDELKQVIKDQKLGRKVFTDPDEVTDLLRRVYLERGFLSAAIAAPEYAFDRDAREARVTLPVTEGPLFTVRKVTTAGNRVQSTAALIAEIPLVPGDPYLPATTDRSLTRLRQIYWRGGYNDVKPAYRLAIDRDAGMVDVQFTIAEGPRSVVADVTVQGNEKTSQQLVRGQLEVKPGEPLDLAALSRSRKNLYDMGAFALVDIKRQELDAPANPNVSTSAPPTAGQSNAAPPPAAQSAAAPNVTPASVTPPSVTPLSAAAAAAATPNAAPSNAAPSNAAPSDAAATTGATQTTAAAASSAQVADLPPGSEPVRLEVSVREVQPWQIRYGGLYDTERGAGGILDISNHNSLGKARVLGLRTRYDSQTREARIYLSQPSLVTLPIQTIASIYAVRERNPSTARADAFNVDRYGVSIQQEKKLRDRYVWSYGYRFERSRTYEQPIADAPRPPLLNVAPLTSTLSRDTRDEPLDATQGSFLSHAFSFSPEWLGSDVRYFKYFGQYFRYLPLEAAKRKRFTSEILRPRFVFATGVRLGLANGLAGLDVPLSERFLAGGSTTLRGFAQNAVGPIGADGVPQGGEAMLVINNELRFPLIGIVDGVAFADVGNVFGRAADFSLRDLRESAGLGIRLRTPWFLVRVDYGIPLDPQPSEARSRAFFSIGQAF